MKKLVLAFLILCAGSSVAQTVDVLSYVCPSDRTTMHLEGTGAHTYCYLDADGLKFWMVKTSNGNPWDLHMYDNDWIYFWITENGDVPGGFNNASGYKRK